MIIEDEELRTLFKAESDEYLQKLEEGLLRLELNPADASLLAELFRDAHSLKGASAMLGVGDVERIAHRFEDALGAAKRNEAPLTPIAIDRMCAALDAIRRLVTQAVTGESSGVDVDRIIEELSAPELAVVTTKRGTPQREETAAAVLSAGDAGVFRFETIRVEPHKLDALMTQTMELLVTRTLIAHRAVQADRIIELWEEWNRSRGKAPPEKFGALLYQLADDIREDIGRIEIASNRLDESVREVRLLPFSTIFNLFPRIARDIARAQNKEVQIIIQGERIAVDKRILEEIKAPLMHMIRNAADHGIEEASEREKRGKPRTGTIRLTATQKGSTIVIEVSDDGRGLSSDSIKAIARKRQFANQEDLERMTQQELQSLIFMPGFSTSTAITGISGRGVGMDVVRTSIEKLKGTISFESVFGAGCTFKIQLPATLAMSRVLVVEVRGELYAIPLQHIQSTRYVAAEDVFTLEGRESIQVDGRPVSIMPVFALLELRTVEALPHLPIGQSQFCVVLEVEEDLLALIVDQLLDEQEVIVRPYGGILKRVRNVTGAAILVDGSVCTVLNPLDLMVSARKGAAGKNAGFNTVEDKARLMILLVEDSITTRTWEKRGLEAAGYDVITAVDGVEALQKLHEHSFDAVVSDVEMPNMDGLTLAARIRQDRKNNELPIVLVTSLARDADRQRGIEAGANAYISKSAFDHKLLVETLKRLA